MLVQSPIVKGRSICSERPAIILPSVSCNDKPMTADTTVEVTTTAVRFTAENAVQNHQNDARKHRHVEDIDEQARNLHATPAPH